MALLSPLISIAFGVAVLLLPKLLRWIVGVYFIVTGVLALMNAL